MMLKISTIVFFYFKLVFTAIGSVDTIVVAQNNIGDYLSIQKAIESLSDTSEELRVIYVQEGVYPEKIWIDKHNLLLIGEGRDKVIITASVARDEWRCSHPDDWGAATININGNDISFKNLTVINSFGYDLISDSIIYCIKDSAIKVIDRYGHQMAVRTMNATRFKAINCVFKSYAGDTMSPWNVKEGMFYFKDCIFEGGVDLYCPRGWAYADNCKFIAVRGSASIWHDGSFDENSKSVWVNCDFDGYKGFQLGRYHRDAQFYLIHCRFSENMSDKEIFQAPSKNILHWGHRVYYYNCHRVGGDYEWFQNNLYLTSVEPDDIDVHWVFQKKWNP